MSVRIKSDRLHSMQRIIDAAMKLRRRICDCDDFSAKSFVLFKEASEALESDYKKLKEAAHER